MNTFKCFGTTFNKSIFLTGDQQHAAKERDEEEKVEMLLSDGLRIPAALHLPARDRGRQHTAHQGQESFRLNVDDSSNGYGLAPKLPDSVA